MSEQKKDGDVPKGVRNVLEGAGAPAGRLSSIRPKRDLTLGGVQRKTFAPTIPAKKTKDEIQAVQRQQPVAGPAETKPSGRGQRGRRGRGDGGRGRGDRGRGRGRGDRKLVQSASVFSAGPGDRTNRRGSWQPSSANLSGPGIKREPGIGGSSSDARRSGTFLGDDDDMGLEEEGMKLEDGDMAPIQLPLTQLSLADPEVTPAELFSRSLKGDGEELMFVQLPDALPASLLSMAAGDENAEPADSTAGGTINLGQMPEGYIGKLQVRKSGRVQIILGGVALDVSPGSRRPCLQQAVTVRSVPDPSNETDIPPGMFFLGSVKHHLVCAPDFETMLRS